MPRWSRSRNASALAGSRLSTNATSARCGRSSQRSPRSRSSHRTRTSRERFSRGVVGKPAGMAALDGRWKVERVSGALPPLYGVEKRIEGDRGETRLGPVPLRFDVDGLRLRYRFPLRGLVDELEPDGAAYSGRALIFGRELGRFAMFRSA